MVTWGPLHEQVSLAQALEAAGWDGVFTWDGIHMGDELEVRDPRVLMARFAAATRRVRIGAILMPLARRCHEWRSPAKRSPWIICVLIQVRQWQAAGATQWIAADWTSFTLDVVRRRIEAGPPRT